MKEIKKYWQIWQTVAKYGLAETLLNRWTTIIFLIGKTLRYGMMLFFLSLLKSNTNGVAGYTANQVVIFYLSYNILDTLAQMFFRGVYHFSYQVKSGELDFYLSKPLNPLFRILTGKPDFIDALFFFPAVFVTIYLVGTAGETITTASFLAYLFLLMNGLFIATAFHIFVICLGVITTEVDNAVMLYRDINLFSRFPVDMYREPLRTVFFFLIPVGLMNTIPAQVLLNLPLTHSISITFGVGIAFLLLSLQTWKWSLKKYTSAGG